MMNEIIKEMEKTYNYKCGYYKGRNDGIDEFAKTLIDEPQCMYWDFCDMVNSVAKRLKEHKNEMP